MSSIMQTRRNTVARFGSIFVLETMRSGTRQFLNIRGVQSDFTPPSPGLGNSGPQPGMVTMDITNDELKAAGLDGLDGEYDEILINGFRFRVIGRPPALLVSDVNTGYTFVAKGG